MSQEKEPRGFDRDREGKGHQEEVEPQEEVELQEEVVDLPRVVEGEEVVLVHQEMVEGVVHQAGELGVHLPREVEAAVEGVVLLHQLQSSQYHQVLVKSTIFTS